MLEFLRSAAAVIFVFGIVVFIHELGHFLAAKWTGVYAPRFSIGFGPALWSRKWGETEYILAAIPLGGYVRMASREDEPMSRLEGGTEQPVHLETVGPGNVKVMDESALTPNDPLEPPKGKRGAPPARPRYWDANALAPFGPHPVPENRLFESKPLPARLLIMFAGVTMNMILGFIVLTAVYVGWGRPQVPMRPLGEVEVPATAPQLGALRMGDVVTHVNGAPVATWSAMQNAVVAAPDGTLRLGTTRGEVTVPLGGDSGLTREALLRALTPRLPAVFGRTIPGQPAARAGIEGGDSVVAAAGQPVRTWEELVGVIEGSAGREIALDIVGAGGVRRTVRVTPVATPRPEPRPGASDSVGKIGAVPRALFEYEYEPVSLAEALRLGAAETAYMTTTVLETLKKLVTREASPRELGGIIQIASESAEAAKLGFESLLRFLALISINLAVFNLLPIPILDGGQILLNVAEAARGKAFSDRTRQWIAYAGLSTILLLVVFALFNDISRQL
jgi:regulator of sigma E protease